MAEHTYHITGTVFDMVTGDGIGGLRVEAWDLEHILQTPVAHADTGADGRFTFDFTDSFLVSQFGDRNKSIYFKIFTGDSLLANTEPTVTWRTADGDVDRQIPIAWSDPAAGGNNPPACTDSQATRYTIAGVVSSPERADLRNLTVRVVDKGIGDDFALSETTTDHCGNFSVTFPATSVTDRGKQRPDVQAHVYSNGELIASSEVRYNATGTEVLTVTLPPNSHALPSEYEAVLSAIASHYGGQLRDLVENDTRHDITYLANKSGWDARAVAFAALADRFSTDAGADQPIPAPYFYALLRTGFSTDPDLLFHADSATVEQTWHNAVDDGVIPASAAADIPTMVARFKSHSSTKFLAGPTAGGISTMSDVLQVSGLSGPQKQQLADLHVDNRTDLGAFWDAVDETFDGATAGKLKVDGKLAYLTVNNAPLMAALHARAGGRITDPVQLARTGLFDWTQFRAVLGDTIAVPDAFADDDEDAGRDRYAQYLASQVGSSYPTASMAYLTASGILAVQNDAGVTAFLDAHDTTFEFGGQPIDQYLADADITNTDPDVVAEIKRMQRMYQIAPNVQSMGALIDNDLDTSAKIAHLDKDVFVNLYGDSLGGADIADAIHDNATTVHNAVLNVIVSYLTAKNGIPLGAQPLDPDLDDDSARQILQPAPLGPGSVDLSQPPGMRGLMRPGPGAPVSSIPAYPTLESLFGSMDFCTCESCRSMLSPAAYLVDLLKFLDVPVPNPPLVQFLARRPDVQHLPLTCENTNTAIPYIDVVNETLEYYVANTLSIANYLGHDTGTMTSEDLLASPAFVNDLAYATLADERFPIPLPFHRPLESLRRHIEKFGATLPAAMETLRHDDSPDRGSNEYGWHDILMEELRISRKEYEILTDSTAVPLWRMYGFPSGTSDASAIATLSNAKNFSRRLEVSYKELVDILKTRFVNPNSDLIPKLERLGVSFQVLKDLKSGAITNAAFTAMLPTGTMAPVAAEYGGNIINWVKDTTNYNRIMSLVVLTDAMQPSSPCSFDVFELRTALPMTSPSDTSTRLAAADYIRILRFIRMWKKLGWTMEQTDAALCALFRDDVAQLAASDVDSASELDTGFLTLLPRLGVIVRMMRRLGLTPARDLDSLLACWADIPTHGPNALYRRMFLNPTILEHDSAYADNGYGEFLTDTSKHIVDHVESLRAAFNLTGDEFSRIFDALGYDATTPLTIPNISAIYRRGFFARALRVSVREFLTMLDLTGFRPFVHDRLTEPMMGQILDVIPALRAGGLKPATAFYLIWDEDLSGTSAPTPAQVNELVRLLRADFAKIDSDFVIVDDPTGDIARARMMLVYGNDATNFFFSLLNNTLVTEFEYDHFAPSFGDALAAAVAVAGGTYGTDNAPRLSYDDFRKRLTYHGVMTTATRDALKNVVTASAVVAEVPSGSLAHFQVEFRAYIDILYNAIDATVGPFFTRYSELQTYYTLYASSSDPVAERLGTLLGNILPSLLLRRKMQSALERLAAAAQVDRAFAEAIVDPAVAANGLYKAGDTSHTALEDLLAVGTQGLSVQLYDGGTIGPHPQTPTIDATLNYAVGSNALPDNATNPGDPISGVWNGYIQATQSGDYRFTIDAQSGSTVTLKLDGVVVPLTQTGAQWRNSTEITLKAGTLYMFTVSVLNVTTTLSIQWETLGHGRSVIEPDALYPATIVTPAHDAYLRFLKAAALASTFKLTASEVARPKIGGASWLNEIPVTGANGGSDLLAAYYELIRFAEIKARYSPGSTLLLDALNALGATSSNPAPLYALTGWDAASVTALASRFGTTVAGLVDMTLLHRVYDAFALAATTGISIPALTAAATNDPTATTVRDLQSALRARYSAEDWRTVVQPINDQMRGLQRDALVAYILHKLRSNPSTANINTPERLFEYFLMDVEMEPCMQTSRIRHALSSVQLFIERCLMNLEPSINPTLLSAKKWEWMKRYRVWEANRKVFLFPENWLEPELRDDKSPFFKELESELLESDITDDTASVAMLNYLSKLEDVAKLEPCGIYNIAGDANGAGEVDHVVARTPGATRKYYYRRREYGYWTPWEKIDLDIEGDPVVPVVWKDRLLLFWLHILKQGPTSTKKATGGPTLNDVTFPPDPNMNVQVILCWSEYYNGKWQPAKTSNVDLPEEYAQIAANSPYPFDRTRIPIYVDEVDGGALRVMIAYSSALRFYNTHGEPLHDYAWAPVSYAYPPAKERWILTAPNDLAIQYIGVGNSPNTTRHIIKPPIDYRIVPTQHPVADIWAPPFFFRDARHVFYVSSTYRDVPLQVVQTFGFPTSPGGTGTTTTTGTGTVVSGPPTVGVTSKPGGSSFSSGLIAGGNAQFGGSGAAVQYVSEDANIQQAFASPALVSYNGKPIGPGGSLSNSAH